MILFGLFPPLKLSLRNENDAYENMHHTSRVVWSLSSNSRVLYSSHARGHIYGMGFFVEKTIGHLLKSSMSMGLTKEDKGRIATRVRLG